MGRSNISRRIFLQSTAAGVATASLPASSYSTNLPTMPMRLGGPVFTDSDDPGVLAEAHENLGYRAAYTPDISLNDKEMILSITKEFQKRDIVIAEVGAWVNMLDPDNAKRKKNMNYVIQRMALAEELGARCCVAIAGSFNPEIWYGPHPENFSSHFFDATVENARKVIDAVNPNQTAFSIEMMGWCYPSSPDEYLRLIRAIDRKAFAVHMDICNIINSPSRIYKNPDVIKESFRKLGPWIVSCHAKDVAWEVGLQIHFKEVIPGQGEVSYKTYLSELSKLPVDAPLMLEHLKTAKEYSEGRQHIQGIAKSLGLSFGT